MIERASFNSEKNSVEGPCHGRAEGKRKLVGDVREKV